jgi:hypothetical protein
MRSGTRDDEGRLHSFNDECACISGNGSKYWYKNGLCHRGNDKPAIVYADGSKAWFIGGTYHRDNGLPAIIYSNGINLWFIRGNQLNNKQVELIKKIMASEIKHLPWLLNEDELLNCVIEKRLNE